MKSALAKIEVKYPVLLISKEYKDVYLFSDAHHCTLVHNTSDLGSLGDFFMEMDLDNFEIYNDKVILLN